METQLHQSSYLHTKIIECIIQYTGCFPSLRPHIWFHNVSDNAESVSDTLQDLVPRVGKPGESGALGSQTLLNLIPSCLVPWDSYPLPMVLKPNRTFTESHQSCPDSYKFKLSKKMDTNCTTIREERVDLEDRKRRGWAWGGSQRGF